MKKHIIILLTILLSLTFVLSSCKKTETSIITTINKISLDIDDLEVEVSKSKTITFETDDLDNLSFSILDDTIALVELVDKSFTITGLKIGSTKLNITYDNELVKTVDINIIDEVLFLPVPTGMLLIKGIDKEASIKVIITKDNLSPSDIEWIIEDDTIIQTETQDNIIKIHSIKRGNTKVTVKLGEYTNSFTVYVTNIRGDLD